MQVLLPPSESKRSGGGRAFRPASLSHARRLGPAREAVREALEALCAPGADEEGAARALKLGVKARGELGHNRALASSGAMPAIERYTGVLYDALDVLELPEAARGWIDEHVSVQSALFGLVSARDRIPAYRLSAGTRLPGLGKPLKILWREAHEGAGWRSLGWVLDLRSKDYAELAPLPPGAGSALHVAQRGPDGAVRALNHFNKAAKGDLVRRLALGDASPESAEEFAAWAGAEGLEVLAGPGEGELTLVTELGPAGAARPAAPHAQRRDPRDRYTERVRLGETQ